jgi:glycosyltransferase EpsJ
MPLVSVIIPIYNVEKYLTRCLESICRQSLSNIEIICVNDGSPDNCGKICDEYSIQDKRIKVIHKENGGLSSARNAGLNIATGDYLYFIDPDDHLDLNLLEKMVNISIKERCEVVLCGYKTLPDEKVNIPKYELNKTLNPIKMIINNPKVHSHNDLCFVWRFLFQRNIIMANNIKFNEKVHVGEDFIFNLEVLIKSTNVHVLGEALYYYTVDNQSSIMRTPYKANLESSLILQYEIKRRLSIDNGLNKSKEYMDDLALYYISSFLSMIIRNIYNGPEKNKRAAIKRILNYEMFRDSCRQIGFSYKCNSFKRYIVYLAIKYRIHYMVYFVYNKQYKYLR